METAFCMHCGQQIPAANQACPHCGVQQNLTTTSPLAPAQQSPISSSIPLPESIKGWSWGAFWLSWIWAIFNKTWIGLLALIPLVNLIMMVVLGLKGREWAWKNKTWSSVEHFNSVQRRWSIAGWIVMVASLLFGITIGVIEDRMKQRTTVDFDTSRLLNADSDNKTPVHGNAQHVDVPPQAKSRYPMPHLTFLKSDLIGAMKRMGMEQHWVSQFTKYLGNPEDFWLECVAQNAASAQMFGGMSQQNAQTHGENTCQGLTKYYNDCFNDKTLDDALLCLQTHINDVAENGE